MDNYVLNFVKTKILVILFCIFILNNYIFSKDSFFPLNISNIQVLRNILKKEKRSSTNFLPQRAQEKAKRLYQKVISNSLQFLESKKEKKVFQELVAPKRFSISQLQTFVQKMENLSFNQEPLIDLEIIIENRFKKQKIKFLKSYLSQAEFLKEKYSNYSTNKLLNEILFQIGLLDFLLTSNNRKDLPRFYNLEPIEKERFSHPPENLYQLRKLFIDLQTERKMLFFFQELLSKIKNFLGSEFKEKIKNYSEEYSLLEKKLISLEEKIKAIKNSKTTNNLSETLSLYENLKENIPQIEPLLLWKKSKTLEKLLDQNIEITSETQKLLKNYEKLIKQKIESRKKTLLAFSRKIFDLYQKRKNIRKLFLEKLLLFKELSNKLYTIYLHPEYNIPLNQIESLYLSIKNVYDLLKNSITNYKNITEEIVTILKEDTSTEQIDELRENNLYLDLLPPYLKITGWEKEKLLLLNSDINSSDPLEIDPHNLYSKNLNLDNIFKNLKEKFDSLKQFHLNLEKKKQEEKEKTLAYEKENYKLKTKLEALQEILSQKIEAKPRISLEETKKIYSFWEEIQKDYKQLSYFKRVSSKNQKLFQKIKTLWETFSQAQKKKTHIKLQQITINGTSVPTIKYEKQIPIVTSEENISDNIEIKLKLLEKDYPPASVAIKIDNNIYVGKRIKQDNLFSVWKIIVPAPSKSCNLKFKIIIKDFYNNQIFDQLSTFSFYYQKGNAEREIEKFLVALEDAYNEKNLSKMEKFFDRFNFKNGNYWFLREQIKKNFSLYDRIYLKIINLTIRKNGDIYYLRLEWQKTLGKNNTNNISEGIGYLYLKRKPNFKIIAIKGDNPFL